ARFAPRHALVDGAKQRLAGITAPRHHTHTFAEPQIGRGRLAGVAYHLDGAAFSDAAGPVFAVTAVGNSAGTDDGARAQIARGSGMRHQLVETPLHFGSRYRAKTLAVAFDDKRGLHTLAGPQW